MDAAVGFEFLVAGLARENDPMVKTSIRSGLLHLARKGSKRVDARRALVQDIRVGCVGTAGRDHVRTTVAYARRFGFWKDLRAALIEDLPAVRDPDVRAAIEDATR